MKKRKEKNITHQYQGDTNIRGSPLTRGYVHQTVNIFIKKKFHKKFTTLQFQYCISSSTNIYCRGQDPITN